MGESKSPVQEIAYEWCIDELNEAYSLEVFLLLLNTYNEGKNGELLQK